MLQRTVYAAIIGVSALVVAFGTLLPWATRVQLDVGPDDVRAFTQITSGSELQAGAFALLFSAMLAALVIWFWVDTGRRRVRLASLLMALVAAGLGYLAWLSLVEVDRFLPSTLLPGPADQFPFQRTTREGVYLTAVGAGIAAVASLAALLFYRPAKDRPAPVLQAIVLPLFLGLPAIVYVALAAWTELGFPFPRTAIQLYELEGESSALALLDAPFRHFVTPLVLVALVAGMGIGVARTRVRRVPLIATRLVLLGYVAFLVFEFAYEPPGYVKWLASPGGDPAGALEDLWLDVQVLWIAALMVTLSIWAGVGVAELLRRGVHLIRPGSAALSGLAAVLLLIAAACADDGPSATEGDLPAGKIIFMSVPPREGPELPAEGDGVPRPPRYVMNADGSGRMPLASPDAPEFVRSALLYGGVVSPDGSRVLFFEATVPEQGLSDLFVANVDGSGRTKITETPAQYSFPAWSPDGTRIVFAGPGGILIANADGSGLVDLGQRGAAGWPSWSPDGEHISFLSHQLDDGQRLYLMKADGANLVRVSDGAATSLAWSPDGSRIAYAESLGPGDDPGVEIFVANADGSERINLSDSPARDWFPTWSPDGTRIAFASLRDGNAEIYVVNADGSGLTNLTNHAGQDFCPAWSPDGRWIAFVSRRDGNREIYLMKADGSARRVSPKAATKISRRSGSLTLPAARPRRARRTPSRCVREG